MTVKTKDPRKLWVSQLPSGDSGQDLTVTIHGYCDNPDCPARVTSVRVNDFDLELPELFLGGAPRCPICSVQMIFNWNHKPIETRPETIRRERPV